MTKLQLFESLLTRTDKLGVVMHDAETQKKIKAADERKVLKTIKNNILDKRLNYNKTPNQIFKYLIEVERLDKEKATALMQWLTKEEMKYY